MLRLGLIGYRNQAERLRGAAERSGLGRVERIYHPRVLVPGTGTHDKSQLLGCDAVLIASPDATHFEYLSYFRDAGYGGYLLCEKSPVTTRAQLEALRHHEGSRVFFNFNLRFSRLAAELRRELASGALGRPIHLSMSLAYGLAFKESYRGSWRADATVNPLGVLNVLGVHLLDLAIALFGHAPRFDANLGSAAGTGSAPDTVSLQLLHASGVTTQIFLSYAAPYQQRITLTATDGLVDYRAGALEVCGPRDTFDEKGRFRGPDTLRKTPVGDDPFEESLETSMATFLSHCAERRPLEPQWFEQSLQTTEILLAIGAR